MQGIPYETFRWDDAFASGWQWPAGGVAIYLVVVLLLSIGMKNAKPFELGSTAVVHNLLLSLGSLVMLLGTLLELHRRWSASESFDWFFCEAPATQTSGPLFFWSYVYYLSKYYEMFDTVLVLLQKSRVPHFKLQVYHHAAVVPMAWLWCQYQQSLQWGGLLFNTFVHVVMYHYYAMKILKRPTPWKRWITKLQIVQFATSFCLLCITASKLYGGAECAGLRSLIFNASFNATLIIQFIGVDKRNKQVRAKGLLRAAEAGVKLVAQQPDWHKRRKPSQLSFLKDGVWGPLKWAMTAPPEEVQILDGLQVQLQDDQVSVRFALEDVELEFGLGGCAFLLSVVDNVIISGPHAQEHLQIEKAPACRWMEVLLHRVDLLQCGALQPGTLDVLPVGKKKQQKVAVGDDTGVLQVFYIKKGEVQYEWKSAPLGREISSVVIQLAKDKIFVGCGQSIHGFTRKGKEFVKIKTNLTETINHLFVEENMIWTGGEYVMNIYDSCKDYGFVMTKDRINDLTCAPVHNGEILSTIIACQDKCLRVYQGEKLSHEFAAVEGSATALGFQGVNPVDNTAHHVGDPVQMIYGTEQGVVGLCSLDAKSMRRTGSALSVDTVPAAYTLALANSLPEEAGVGLDKDQGCGLSKW
ncbi:BBS7 [Symbiodinium pilosum]|uniref:BBS7 protein n=1 Tax=Symbiodinium pilosum TaxID=2952 RepID=A0A812LW28_SYMPI|nr:BBS7 [Symbiodinium pilosum]